MDKIKQIAKQDGYDIVKALGVIDGVEYYAVYDSNDAFEDIWCYISRSNKGVEKIFMGMLMIGDEEACEEFEKNDPVGKKRKFLADNFEIFR